ncbi:molybdopterin converting factor subunit 1 [Thioalkalivibrio sulfidiphilus]|uniref:molybdopterin converting factor subunit 1 n=1 Tax=Thioalkalivibrio sulfidiphilus TaxID=1033854 RepID=UPI00037096FF|nr:molybdopterin converting factor subunit 1 [Thioalkalivibrio sulfidiphilus]
MSITVRYFASLRERVGRAEDQLDADGNDTAGGIWARAVPEQAMPDRVLIAINQEYADADHPVRDGDEVAFFPPVTGG